MAKNETGGVEGERKKKRRKWKARARAIPPRSRSGAPFTVRQFTNANVKLTSWHALGGGGVVVGSRRLQGRAGGGGWLVGSW